MSLLDVALVVIAYLVGSIPTGVLLAKTAGVDVRSEGSGNIGATNVARTAGRWLGILTLVGDLTKGLVPVVLARVVSASPTVMGTVGFAALAGHVFPLFLGLRGGKGVATGVGVLLGLTPLIAWIPVGVFAAVFAVTRIVSAASLVAVVCAPGVLALTGQPGPVVLASLGMALLITYRHRENIDRLRSGTEPRFESLP